MLGNVTIQEVEVEVDMFHVDVDTSKLNKAIAEFTASSKDELDEVIKKQTGIIVGHLIAVTPPGRASGHDFNKEGRIATSAKKLGESQIRSDLAKLFPTTNMKPESIWANIERGRLWKTHLGERQVTFYADSVYELRRAHQKARNRRTGRVRIGNSTANMALTKARIKNQYTKEQIAKVGLLNAGWLQAAGVLKTKAVPKWITRHGRQSGDVRFKRSNFGLSITVSNRMGYYPTKLQKRMQMAVDRRTHAIVKALEAMAERRAAKFNKQLK